MQQRPASDRRGIGGATLVPISVFAIGCTQMLDFDSVSKGSPETNASLPCSQRNPKPYFCDDFDGKPLGENWPDAEPPKNGIIRVEGGVVARTAPNALVSYV